MYVNQKHLNRNYTMLKVFKGKREGEEGGRLYEPLSYFGMNMCNVWISLNMIYAYHKDRSCSRIDNSCLKTKKSTNICLFSQ